MEYDIAEAHPSGVGVYLYPPVGVWFRFWRTPDSNLKVLYDERGQPIGQEALPLMVGFLEHPKRYLDLEAAVEETNSYRLEVAPSSMGPWSELWVGTVDLEPLLTYSAVEDGETFDAVNPRDALVLFYATRLAQLARMGRLRVKKPTHQKRYRAVASHEFNEPDLPILALNLSGGRGAAGDLGFSFTEENLRIDLLGATQDKDERDSLRDALRGLLREVDYVLEDLGCSNIEYGDLQDSISGTSPTLYLVEMSISMQAYIWHGIEELRWELIPVNRWFDDGTDPPSARIE